MISPTTNSFVVAPWGDWIPVWVIQHNNDQMALQLQLAYHNWQLNVANCRVLNIRRPEPYNLSKARVWCETIGDNAGAD